MLLLEVNKGIKCLFIQKQFDINLTKGRKMIID